MAGQYREGDGLQPIEVLEAGSKGLGPDQLQRLVGFVVDIDLESGTNLSGVIVGVSAVSVIIEGWDSAIQTTNGELSTVAIGSVRRISIP